MPSSNNKLGSSLKLRPIEIIAKAIHQENLLKEYRSKKQDLFIDRFKHMSISRKELKKSSISNNSIDNNVIINRNSFGNVEPMNNLFYHHYPFCPQLLNKDYNPHIKKYTDLLPKQSIKDVSIQNNLMNDINYYSKLIRLGSYVVSAKYYPIRLNIQDRKVNIENYSERQKGKSKKEIKISRTSDVNIQNKNENINKDKVSFCKSHKHLSNSYGCNFKNVNNISMINHKIMKSNNQISINCIKSKFVDSIPRTKILLPSMSKSYSVFKKDKSYYRIRQLEQKIYKILKKY